MGKIKEFYHEQITREQSISATRWFRANNKSDKLKGAEIDAENGAIYGVAICTEGEALGHGVWLDSAFIADVVKLGKAYNYKKGLKARFGHPSMSGESLGTFIGRFQNFRQEGTKAVADLYLDDSAKNTPNGNLYDYILKLAENPDVFGASIVFAIDSYFFKKTNGEAISTSDHYRNQDAGTVDYSLELDNYGYPKYYVKMKELYGSDLVDEPAANPDGLFSQLSSANLHADKFAVIATNFLKSNPQIAAFVEENPHKITEFMKKFKVNESGKKPLDDDDDDLLLQDDSPSDNEPTDGTEGAAHDAPVTESSDDDDALLSKISKMFDEKFGKVESRLKAIEKRVGDLEENPTADPTFSKKKKDDEGGKPKAQYSWQKEWDERYGGK